MSRPLSIAIVGATGLVGETMCKLLESREFPVRRLSPLASHRSAGAVVPFNGEDFIVENLEEFDFSDTDIALFSAGASVSAIHAPRAAAAGAVVIDNTSQFRRDEDIPLVVPEVNSEAIAAYDARRIIANPNCSTIQLAVALKPIYDAVGIERINVATYQSVSGAGRSFVNTMVAETGAVLAGEQPEPANESWPIAFNCIPHIDAFQDNGYTREEMKIVWEIKRILDDDSIRVNATAVRVPVYYGHSEAVHLETRDRIAAEDARALLAAAPGVELVDSREARGYPTAVSHGAGADAVFVGRIREDISHERGLNLWVVSDNIRKGAALNSIQVAEILAQDYI